MLPHVSGERLDLVTEILEAQARHGLFRSGTTTVVAVSGGPDSVALLHGLSEVADRWLLTLTVAHLDHSLRPDSVDDAAFVARSAADLGLHAELAASDVAHIASRRGWSVEEAGRKVRYGFLATVARRVRAECVVTAHHAGDQAETVLAHIVAGTGMAGLGGMRHRSAYPLTPAEVAEMAELADFAHPGDQGSVDLPALVRPLLSLPRDRVREFLAERNLEWREDKSNEDLAHTRNRIRHVVVPALEAINPKVLDAIVRVADTARAEDDLVSGLAADVWVRLARRDAALIRIDFSALRAEELALRRRIVRRAALEAGALGRALGPVETDQVLELADGAAVTLPGGVRARHKDGELTFQVERVTPPPPSLPPIKLAVPGRTVTPGGWAIIATPRVRRPDDPPRTDPWHAVIDADRSGELQVRGRHVGDRMVPLGMEGRSKSLQDLFVDEGVPADWRASWPVVVASFGIAWVPGLRLDERATLRPATSRVIEMRVAPPWGEGLRLPWISPPT
jgi:tRNA(Ile)-lysidine synthetase-like protein